ncbi:hypothetical protein EIN_472770 [Entamoeba invadens IP1]|uniref:small monomeric GTPase n=1 Tax=Entamoeba invadens IP1 TaxID=370355 RepID=A0A0A1U682_ENTIV|nr:hypothetical protein EIN_472770 [Entamoeba invadens IP1]ELP89899.1 hypothetical protein EIN_472770 [Entamoeba invadens IP1]|eukprot:XP_004256670.1 hypothetical protein EIN_472770 [Entamoeba invadens IP1]
MTETKIMLLGCNNVGKTSIVTRFVCNKFTKVYEPTLDEPEIISVTVDGDIYLLELLDVANCEELSAYREHNIHISDGFIVVYSITNSSSFYQVTHFIETIYRIFDKESSERIPMVLCGNKCDMECNRIVTTKEGRKLAEELNILFYEVSAKNNINIKEVVNDLLREVNKHKNDVNTTKLHCDTNKYKNKSLNNIIFYILFKRKSSITFKTNMSGRFKCEQFNKSTIYQANCILY